ncbi:response regulator transcription factor [Aggregatilinea lenta]|uniref:response regulator transcription factor n=1 Tax=Aggregatilinea lenta TaxID=913108 RepID=UPI000E5B0A90|nr:response regulator transcription factor [Aggregatilinea lenta]
MAKTILIVDDKLSVRIFLKDLLGEQGFRVVTATNGREALFAARHEKPDLILLDIMMPEMDGYEFIQIYRKEGDAPIILLTAVLEESDKVLGLELGADDYITKPFGPRELIARTRAVLRRAGQEEVAPDVLRAGAITLDRSAYQVFVDEREVTLTPSEFALLELLISLPGRAFSRAELLEHLKGGSPEGVERTVDVHIRNLRSKIEPDTNKPLYIETVFGVGYRFRAE